VVTTFDCNLFLLLNYFRVTFLYFCVQIIPASDYSQPSLMHDLHGSVDFKNGQTSGDVIIDFPADSLEDEEK